MKAIASRQLLHQRKNKAHGMCRGHTARKATHGVFCEECHEKNLALNRKINGWNPATVAKAQWARVDFSPGPKLVAKALRVGSSTVLVQMKKRGWRKLWVGPHQQITNKPSK